jgi:hypothetical protein
LVDRYCTSFGRTKGKTTLPNLKLFENLIQAGDQALVDLRLCSLVNYMDPTNKEGTQQFLALVEPKQYRFQLRANITSAQWLTLLNMGILLYRKETNFVVQVHKLDGSIASYGASQAGYKNI